MNKPQKYRITAAGKSWPMEKLTPSEKVILLALKIADHERPEGIERKELRTAAGLPEKSFNRAWALVTREKLAERMSRKTIL